MGRNGLPNLRVARRIVSGSGICQATIGMIGQFLCSAGGRFFVPA
jgi:hypothetical protein